MALRIDSGALQETVSKILDEYGASAAEALRATSKTVAKDVVKDLKKAGDFKGTGDFRKGWTSKTEETRLGAASVVYNKDQPGLAHLLEFGHAKRGGGRTKAFNFIAPIADTVEERFTRTFADEMEGQT